jgi:hypothetical protein
LALVAPLGSAIKRFLLQQAKDGVHHGGAAMGTQYDRTE